MLENQTEYVRARISPAVKAKAEAIFDQLGLGHTEAIRLFYQQVLLNRGLPFSVNVPNATTRRALNNIRLGKNLHKTTIQKLRDEFGA